MKLGRTGRTTSTKLPAYRPHAWHLHADVESALRAYTGDAELAARLYAAMRRSMTHRKVA